MNTKDRGLIIVAEVDAPGEVIPSQAGDLVLIKLGEDGLIPGCSALQPSPHAVPVEKSPSSVISSIALTPFRSAVIKGHEILPESIPPENLQIEDGFDNFSTHCVFPAYPDPAPAVFDADSEFAGQIDADVEELHPLAIGDGTFVGASRGGGWVSADRAIETLGGVLQFQVHSIGLPPDHAQGVVRRAMDNGVCSGAPTISFSGQMANPSSLALAADWDAQPRIVSELSPSLQVYQDLLHGHLKDAGIDDAKTSIDSLVRADLDGDGLEEVIMSASWYEGGLSNRGVSAGDYSVVLMRSLVQGEVRTIAMINEIFSSLKGATIPVRYRIAGVLDLNGDGPMEIIIRADSEAARGYLVFEVHESTPTAVLQMSCPTPFSS
jgi:hypothetical protein